MAKSANDMSNSMIKNLKEKTGKPLSEWVKIALKTKIDKHKALLNHIKENHGLTYGYANLVALKTLEQKNDSAKDDDELIITQYSVDKEALKPIYDEVISQVQKFGDDIKIAPKKAYVSLRRKKQFAIIQPSTKSRVDIGINIKSAQPTQRLEKSRSFNQMVSHRVRVTNKKEINKDLIGWLKQAYNEA